MSGGGTQNSLRKAMGAIKDTTTVNLAKLNSDYKELDIAIVKATNHVERPAKEKHIRAVFSAISATRPRADVAYCIHGLARRLSKTHNWAVALKTLIIIHRALREVDPTFHEEVINYEKNRNHMLNMSHFKDDSSPQAWDYSGWVRSYALFLEERLECFRLLEYDIETAGSLQKIKETENLVLLEQLPALQLLLYRVLGCQPKGAAAHNFVIQLALSMVASESIKIYQAITDGCAKLVDKSFKMQRKDALEALDIYRRAGRQAEGLSEFYEVCKNLDLGRGEKFPKIEQSPQEFLQAMEEYVKEAPQGSTVRKEQVVEQKTVVPKVVLALEDKKIVEEHDAPPESSSPPPEVLKVEAPIVEPPDLLGLNCPSPDASKLDEQNALALAIVPASDHKTSTSSNPVDGSNGWELALLTAPSSNEAATTASKLAGGFDLLTLDSLYDDALRRNNQNGSYNPWEHPGHMAGPMLQQPPQDPFFASNAVAAPHSVQMASMANQQHAFAYQQQQQMMMGTQLQQPANPFGNPFGPAQVAVQAYNPYAGLI